MGGINPNRPDGYLVNRAVHEHCRALFRGASNFFAAHAQLEELVMAEADGVELDRNGLRTVETQLAAAIQEFQSIEPNVTDEVINAARTEGTWQAEYFTQQLALLAPLRDATARLAARASADEVAEGAGEGLQDSLWHDGVNSDIRTSSVDIVRALIHGLSHHLDVVVETNS